MLLRMLGVTSCLLLYQLTGWPRALDLARLMAPEFFQPDYERIAELERELLPRE